MVSRVYIMMARVNYKYNRENLNIYILCSMNQSVCIYQNDTTTVCGYSSNTSTVIP